MKFRYNPLTGRFDIVRDTGVGGEVTSTPGSGEHQVTDIRLDSAKKVLIKYNEDAEA